MEDRIKGLSVREKIGLCSGRDFWHTKGVPEAGIPEVMMCDGPHGLRKQIEDGEAMNGNRSVPATCFPAAVTSACGWDPELMEEIGEAIAKEAAANGVGLVLGPGANIKRNPLCGRNFEYFSEDPLLAGKLAAGFIRGVEGTGVSSCLKHFALNNQEYKRLSSDSVVDERTMREIYLAAFETAVKEGRPSAVMCAYNKVNGVHCSDNKKLLTDILRDEWGFEGLVVSDWGAMWDRIEAFKAGCDLNMPGGSAYMEAEARRAVKSGELDEKCVDRSAGRVARLAIRGNDPKLKGVRADMEANYELARRAAAESAVLLKNEGGLLPLLSESEAVFIGHMARAARYQGSGSSHINPWRLKNVMDVCENVKFVPGCDADGETTDELVAEAVEAAKSAKKAVIFAGLTDKYESEGFDREDMTMPSGQLRLIEAVAEANENTAVVLFCGSPVETPWVGKVKAVLYMGLPGEAAGDATADILFGRVSPSGKLAESWPVRYSDCVSSGYYAHGRRDAHYREGVYVGYRYYVSAGVKTRFAFGHGLSYTSFEYSGLEISGESVKCTVKNTGEVAGAEVAQLYITPPEGNIYRPKLELRGFEKVYLEPGESREIVFHLTDRAFAVWNGGWVVPGGRYTVSVGSGSDDLRLSGTVDKPGTELDAPRVPEWYFEPKGAPEQEDFEVLIGRKVTERTAKKGEFTMENSVLEMKDDSLVMKILYKYLVHSVGKNIGVKDRTDPYYRMMISCTADSSLTNMKINGRMNNYVLEGLLEMANGHGIRGIRTMRKKAEK